MRVFSEALMLKSLFIANRGEIAVRIIRAARELGIRTIQAHSAADAQSLAVKLADEAVNIGPPHAAKSYLNIPAIIDAARQAGADAIHPGYGFLAENASFAEAVDKAGMIFVGPSAQAIRTMGDKVEARIAAEKAGVPVVPGSGGRIDDLDEATEIAERIGFPVMIKAAAGGGGRGIRIAGSTGGVRATAAAGASVRLWPLSAMAGFISRRSSTRPAISKCRCWATASAPSTVSNANALCSAAVRKSGRRPLRPSCPIRCARSSAPPPWPSPKRFTIAAPARSNISMTTRRRQFYFIEMNTRIQVEHPVTEFITGLDLMREMILIAGGERLRHQQKDILRKGHAIEVRINAEDPAKNFMPFPGTVSGLAVPGGPGTRFDTMLYHGYQVPPFYDSLLGKLIVWDENAQPRDRPPQARAWRTRHWRAQDDQALASPARR